MGFLGDLTGALKLHKLPIAGSFFDDPDEEAKQRAFMQASQLYNAYRPEAAQTRTNALRMQLSARDGARNWLAQMAPGVYQAPVVENPMSPRQQTLGGVTGANIGGPSAGKVLGSMGSGAGGGALLGTSISPGYGTAVGAVAGGALGLVSALGKDNQESWSLNSPGIMQAYDPMVGARRRAY